MTDDPSFPYRPRLSEDAMLRRHRRDGEETPVLYDRRREEAIEITEAQLAQLRACDGTRDVGGVMLAAAREGGYRRASEIEGLLAEMHERGLLADGLPVRRLEPLAPERPLEILPGFALRCDGHGGCCTVYSSVPFTRGESMRAAGLVPEAAADDRTFLPLYGAGDDDLRAVSLFEGRCAFLGAGGACRIHEAAGENAKPRGCRVFPATHVDDGEAVRVSVAVECRCVLSSLEQDGGEPIVPEGARTEADLVAGTRVRRLPATIAVDAGASETREALRRWSTALAEPLRDIDDGVAALWSLARAVAEQGLDPEAAVAAVAEPTAPQPAALGAPLLRLAATTADKRASAESWRGRADRVRGLSGWLDDAAQALLDRDVVAQRLAEGGRADHERFFLRALVHGHALADDGLPLAGALRDRAVRLLLARQAATGEVDDPSRDHPITAVEAMMRGQGLAAYAR